MSLTVARLVCDEPTARRLAAYLGRKPGPRRASAPPSRATTANGRWRCISRAAPHEPACARWSRSPPAKRPPPRSASRQSPPPTGWRRALPACGRSRAGRFLVHGAHDRARVAPNDIGIEIEAALAFGTGHHGTTRGCLLALDVLAKRRRARRVLDVGTGSGVLAIAAAKVFRTRVTASDIDRVAVEAARANARLNRAAPDRIRRTPPAPSARVIAARRAVRSDLRQYPARTSAAAGGAAVAASPDAARASCCPACCRRHANGVLAIYRRAGLCTRTPHRARRLGHAGVEERESKPPRRGRPGRFRW